MIVNESVHLESVSSEKVKLLHFQWNSLHSKLSCEVLSDKKAISEVEECRGSILDPIMFVWR